MTLEMVKTKKHTFVNIQGPHIDIFRGFDKEEAARDYIKRLRDKGFKF